MSTMMLATMMKIAAEQHRALDDREVRVDDRVVVEPADPGDVEHRLGHHRAAEQERRCRARARHDRGDRRAHAVAPDHAALAQSLGPRRADVVLAHHLDQAAAQQPRVDRGRASAASTNHGMISDVNHCHGIVVSPHVAAGAGQDLELADVVGEQEQHDQPEPEHRHRDEHAARCPSRRGRAACRA